MLNRENLRQFSTFALLGWFLVQLSSSVTKAIKACQEKAQLDEMEVLSIEDVEENLKHYQDKTILLRLQVYYFEPIRKKMKLRSSQVYHEPPLKIDLSRSISKEFNRHHQQNEHVQERIFASKEWFAMTKRSSKPNSAFDLSIPVHGFGELVENIFTVDMKYEEDVDKSRNSFWSRLEVSASSVLWRILNAFKSKTHSGPLPAFGPFIGSLLYEISLKKGASLVVKCKIIDGKIIPSVTAGCKQMIISHASFRRFSSLFVVSLGFGLLSVQLFLMRTTIRRIWNRIKKMIGFSDNDKFNPSEVTDDKMCIICYVNCRNVIFFQCRHLLICESCLEDHSYEICPVCKTNVIANKGILCAK